MNIMFKYTVQDLSNKKNTVCYRLKPNLMYSSSIAVEDIRQETHSSGIT